MLIIINIPSKVQFYHYSFHIRNWYDQPENDLLDWISIWREDML